MLTKLSKTISICIITLCSSALSLVLNAKGIKDPILYWLLGFFTCLACCYIIIIEELE